MSIEAHSKNLIANLTSTLKELSDSSNLSLDKAFDRLAAEWLGYELPEQQFIDGSSDKGIDFWFQSDSGFDIYQAKSHELLADGELDTSPFDKEGVTDLQRAKNFLLSDAPKTKNEGLKQLRHHWQHAIDSRRESPESEAIIVNLGLVVLGNGLTSGAQQDFDAFSETLSTDTLTQDVPVHFAVTLFAIDDLVKRRWRMDNRSWKDIAGAKKDYVDLQPENPDDFLQRKSTAVFYCRAYDLVKAYEEFGYQIFEPNVRCNIKMSKINAAIRASVQSRLGREEFRFLNNGVTIICKGYAKPTTNRPAFRVTEPGVVNGLQTVFALQEGYRDLRGNEKEHFEKSCYVLVRLLQEKSISDIRRMVRATNTQNPMQPRNLVSNNIEQILFERLFADLGWFYERKQDAWDAYAADSRRWRTLPGKSKEFFQYNSGGRPRVRCVDNELLAQCWLSFVGFSEEANHARASIFGNENWYDFVFLHTPNQHGVDFNYNFQEAREASTSSAPDPSLMLAAYLARDFARAVVPSQRITREASIKRLGIDPKASKEEIELKLSTDTEYVLGQVLAGMSLLFVEFLGLILYRFVPNEVNRCGARVLSSRSFRELKVKQNFEEIASVVNSQDFDQGDLLGVSWWAFRHCLEELVGGSWLTEYRQARSRNRFIYSSETRNKLQKGLQQLHQYTQRTQLTRPWAIGIAPPEGLFGFFSKSLGKT
jgi:hypothetical protein